eukprot:GEMP01023644.1.p2 GENE.GEMP01023644.1~~GEMP01023644.1.p2  ORF type:complete len:100 (+),score=27.01 GEMP01023644.1:37-336(+)
MQPAQQLQAPMLQLNGLAPMQLPSFQAPQFAGSPNDPNNTMQLQQQDFGMHGPFVFYPTFDEPSDAPADNQEPEAESVAVTRDADVKKKSKKKSGFCAC